MAVIQFGKDQGTAPASLFDRLVEALDAPATLACVIQRGTILTANPQGLELLRAPTAEAVLGCRFQDFLVPAYRTAFDELLRTSVGESSRQPMRLMGYEGEVIPVELRIIPVRDIAANCSIVVARAELPGLLPESARTLAAHPEALAPLPIEDAVMTERIVEMLPNPVWFKDAKGRFHNCNRAFRELFRLDGLDWRGTTAEQLLPHAVASQDDETDRELIATGARRMLYETYLAPIEGRDHYAIVAKTVLVDGEGRTHGILGVLTDITERKRVERELHRLATTDPLTGALNRRHMLSACSHEAERAQRYGRPLSLVMLDLDHFKRINDGHGHAVGDRALKAAVAACRETLRDVDLVGRMGGEEFAILLPETPLESALAVADRLREAIQARRLPLAQGMLQVTASLGVAQWQAEDQTVEQTLERADKALYRAKNAGRNRVEPG